MNWLRAAARRRNDDERGATLILVAITMTLFITAAGFSVNLGRTYVVNRSLQALADASALDAARYLEIPETTSTPSNTDNLTVHADNALSDNSSNGNLAVTQGIWSITSGQKYTFTAETSRFCKGTTPPSGNIPCNAVEVTASTLLNKLFGSGSSTLSRSAIAAVTPEASFSIGTYLASYSSQQTAVLNDVLGAVGGSSNLTVAGYSGLANTFVTVQQLIDASGGVLTPSNFLNLSVTGSNWDSYLYNAVASQAALLSCGSSPVPAPCAADTVLRPFAQTPGPLSSTSLQLCNIVSIDGSTCGSQLSQLALNANINVLQTLVTESEDADLINNDDAINVTNALDITNLLSSSNPIQASLSLTLVQPPQVAFGPVGTTATTGQVNASLNLTVPITGVGNQTLTIPLSGATGTASLQTVTCSNNSLYSAKISASTTTSGPNSVTLNGSQIASLTLTGAPSTTLGFGAAYVPPSSSTIGAGVNANPDPISTTSPTVSFSSQSGGLNALVSSLLNSTLPPILAPVLQSLGIAVAGADVADLSTSCGAISLVQ